MYFAGGYSSRLQQYSWLCSYSFLREIQTISPRAAHSFAPARKKQNAIIVGDAFVRYSWAYASYPALMCSAAVTMTGVIRKDTEGTII